jgi:hypothetical protein
MGVDFYLLPNTAVNADAATARDWLDREGRRFGEIPSALDPATETRKRTLADILLKMKAEFREFKIDHAWSRAPIRATSRSSWPGP